MVRQEACAAAAVERFFQLALLGLAASAFLALAGTRYLNVPTFVLVSVALAIRAVLVLRPVSWRPSNRVTIPLAIACSVFPVVDAAWFSRPVASCGINFAVYLTAIHVVSAHKERDFLWTALLSFAALVAAAFVSLGFVFLLALLLFLGFAAATMTAAEMRRSLRQAAVTSRARTGWLGLRLAIHAICATACVLALSAGLFFLSPHAAGAALGRALFHRISLPGFSRHISLGEIGRVQTSSRTVLHARIYSAEPVANLKWRGGALVYFDGRDWSNPNGAETRLDTAYGRLDLIPTPARRPGRHLVYDISLDAIDSDALFFLGTPEHVDLHAAHVLAGEAGSYRLDAVPPRGFAYETYSRLEDPPEAAAATDLPPLAEARRLGYLQLPRLDPRVAALAANVTEGAEGDLAKARAVERYLRQQYGYTLDLPRRQPADPLADFLFVRQKGHCEYFASALAVMLRTQGIPARLATGFHGGIYNPLNNLWLIRASDAHAWVEAWISGHGWTTLDATPPVPRPAVETLATRMEIYGDAIEGLWEEWIVSYDPNHQGSLMDRVQQGAARVGIRWFDSLSDAHSYWDGPAGTRVRRTGRRVLLLAALAMLLRWGLPPVYRAWRLRRRVGRVRRGQAAAGDATLLYRRLLEILKRRGYQKPPWFTPAEFAASLPASPLGEAVGEFTSGYNAWRFGGRAEGAAQLSRLLEEIERTA